MIESLYITLKWTNVLFVTSNWSNWYFIWLINVLICSISFLQVMSSTAASSAIAALSPGGVLMQGGAQQAINRTFVTQSSDI